MVHFYDDENGKRITSFDSPSLTDAKYSDEYCEGRGEECYEKDYSAWEADWHRQIDKFTSLNKMEKERMIYV